MPGSGKCVRSRCSLEIKTPLGKPERNAARMLSSINLKTGQLVSSCNRIRTCLVSLVCPALEEPSSRRRTRVFAKYHRLEDRVARWEGFKLHVTMLRATAVIGSLRAGSSTGGGDSR